ncbi:MAG: hypothetical protein PVH00_00920 [Gemmatimonadota bacterium]|jgi:hypothetical protein
MTRRIPTLFLGMSMALLPAACESAAAPTDDYTVSDVLGADLPPADLSRTWKYVLADVNADSLVRVLLTAPLVVEEAWEPLEDLCDDPIGPRFTVVLAAPDPDIAEYDFEPGNGIRACTRLVRRYVPVR